MQTCFEHFAVASMLGGSDSPPRLDGKLCFGQAWERQVFGVAMALSRTGHFDWEDFRQKLIAAIGEWEHAHLLDDPSWSYYERWLTALERLLIEEQLVTAEELVARLASQMPADVKVADAAGFDSNGTVSCAG
jgi:nitrile hydratase accessory protein